AGSACSGCSVGSSIGGGSSGTIEGSASPSSTAAVSIRALPEGSFSCSPIRRTASATTATLSATSDDSCGHVDNVLPTSTRDAAIRGETRVASVIRSAYGSLSLLLKL